MDYNKYSSLLVQYLKSQIDFHAPLFEVNVKPRQFVCQSEAVEVLVLNQPLKEFPLDMSHSRPDKNLPGSQGISDVFEPKIMCTGQII